ncbi:hypothetical protein JTE90_004840 [Oedothorax gibbosus]|uniref:Uncharacterized protein n=1 Tax=Oedothorax gibbosus TaxID=931172 RepID=A0AAV6UTC7_9ARAC|nr:hypothetical protein JTE90_004840 [Oedothorax gibbosus]
MARHEKIKPAIGQVKGEMGEMKTNTKGKSVINFVGFLSSAAAPATVSSLISDDPHMSFNPKKSNGLIGRLYAAVSNDTVDWGSRVQGR